MPDEKTQLFATVGGAAGGAGVEKTAADADQKSKPSDAELAADMPDFMKGEPGNPPKIAAQVREKWVFFFFPVCMMREQKVDEEI